MKATRIALSAALAVGLSAAWAAPARAQYQNPNPLAEQRKQISDAQAEVLLSALEYFLTGGKKRPPAIRKMPEAKLKILRAAFAESSLSVLTV